MPRVRVNDGLGTVVTREREPGGTNFTQWSDVETVVDWVRQPLRTYEVGAVLSITTNGGHTREWKFQPVVELLEAEEEGWTH